MGGSLPRLTHRGQGTRVRARSLEC